VDAYGFVYTSMDFKSWSAAKNASEIGSSFPVGCCQDLFLLPAVCEGCAGPFLGARGSPSLEAPTHVWTGWPPGTPGVYELAIYHEGPVNSSGIKEVVPLGLPELALNFSWHDHGHFAATKSFFDPVHKRRIVSSWLGGFDCPVPGLPLQQFKTNSQGLLREVRYDPRLRMLTTFPVAEIAQLRGPNLVSPALPPAGAALTSGANTTLVLSGANQSEVRFQIRLDPWPTQPTAVGVKVLAAETLSASAPSVELFIVVHPPPSAGAKVWRADAFTRRENWGANGTQGGGATAGSFPIIAGEDIDVVVYIDNTWIEWFVQGGRFAQTLAVPPPALILPGQHAGPSVQQGVALFTNATRGVHVSEAAVYSMSSIWRNEKTHDRPCPSSKLKTDDTAPPCDYGELPHWSTDAISLVVLPCNASSSMQQWGGATLTKPGSGLSALTQESLCVTSASANPVEVVKDCAHDATRFLFSANGSLSIAVAAAGTAAGKGVGACIDVNHGDGPDVDIYSCHGAGSPDASHQLWSYDKTAQTLASRSAKGMCLARNRTLLKPFISPPCVWPSVPPSGLPFARSTKLRGITVLENATSIPSYGADTWYPAEDRHGNLFSGFDDGGVDGVSVGSACTRPRAACADPNGKGFHTGSAVVSGDSWRNLSVRAPGPPNGTYEDGFPMQGRYTCANAVSNGTWWVGTYGLAVGDASCEAGTGVLQFCEMVQRIPDVNSLINLCC